MDVSELRFVEKSVISELVARMKLAGWIKINSEGPGFGMVKDEGLAIHFDAGLESRRSDVSFMPSIGVQHRETADLVSRFKGREERGLAGPSTVGIGLSDLLYRQGIEMAPLVRWTIPSSAKVVEVVTRLLEDLEVFGGPWFESFRSLEDLIRYMEEERGGQEVLAPLSIAAALAGRMDAAILTLNEYVNIASAQKGLMLEQSRRFIRSFIEHFDVGGIQIP